MPSYMQCIKCSQQMERTVNELLAPINAEMKSLREKVEAWEWYEEVRTCDPWREHPYWTACGRASHLRKDQNSIGTKRARAFENAIAEWQVMLDAACEAVHADRE